MRCVPTLSLLFLLVLPAAAKPGAGTVADPVVVDALPYALRGTTVGAAHAIDRYSCSSASEAGGEVVFAFTLPAPARVSAWVSGDAGMVDNDVHLLDTAALSGTTATACVARGDEIAEADLGAGPHLVVVDAFASDAHAGAFVLHLDAVGDAWSERPVAQGVTWRARRHGSLGGGRQVVGEVVIDPSVAGVQVRSLASTGCQTVGALGTSAKAVAGINGGYFDVSSCAPVSLLKANGKLLGTNASSSVRGAFGVSSAGLPLVARIGGGVDWPAAAEAHGGGPVVVETGKPLAGSAAWAQEGFMSTSFFGRNPRTVAGRDASGRIHLVSVDGRRATAAGLSMDALGAFCGGELGLVDAVNLDGGGSTTLWVAGATPSGVVNYPSDATVDEDPTHPGSRPVSGGLFVFASPLNHAPRFQTQPSTAARSGEAWLYDADALDLDVNDVVRFALVAGPTGLTVDAATGEVRWTPTSGGAYPVTVSAGDGRGGEATQAFNILVDGAVAPSGDGGAAGSDDAGAAGPGADTGGGCRLGGAARGVFGLALLALLVLVTRRRARSPRR